MKRSRVRMQSFVRAFFLLLAVTMLRAAAWADAGVLLPRDRDQPDASVLSLAEMRVEVWIDNGDARVRIVQIFANHTNRLEEGTYRFGLPDASTVSDFAVWDGPVRIPAVVLERKRAGEVYEDASLQALDPGLLEMGERTDDEARSSSLFTAKISPIPAYGTKRLEVEYHQRIRVDDLGQVFLLPLKPSAYAKQVAGAFSLHVVIKSAYALSDMKAVSKLYPLTVKEAAANAYEASFSGENVALDEDFALRWKLDAADADGLKVTTFRSAEEPLPQPDESAPVKASEEPGFFAAQMLVGEGRAAAAAQDGDRAAARTVVVLFDNSLSMQWDKLEKSYAAFEGILGKLRPQDRFNVLLFNQAVTPFRPMPVNADAANIQAARAMVRGSRLRGGTDLGAALSAGLKQCDAANCLLLVLTDGGSDRGASVLPRKIAAGYAAAWKAAAQRPKTDIFAVGDDANTGLLELLARENGVMVHVTSTEPVEYKLTTFLSEMTRDPVTALKLGVQPRVTRMVYPLDAAVFPGSMAEWVGEYDRPAKGVVIEGSGVRDGAAIDAKAIVDLPAVAEEHTELPRLWAQARVHALLEEIAEDGESRAAIDEIIRLSRRYKFVTPYTSFLAVPRSLLRPRVIRPGDPVLRVRTDDAIDSVIALLPFGLTKPLRHLASEDTAGPEGGRLWETRFLAPPEMKDGTYSVRLLLRDREGRVYREEKTFVIASTPPTVKVLLASAKWRRGETVMLKVKASRSTRTISARLEGLGFVTEGVSLRWNPESAVNTGMLAVPADLPVGRYELTVTAEDVAHNLGTEEVAVDVEP